MTHSFLLLAVYALCVYRLTHLVTSDTITLPIREWLHGKSHQLQVREVLDHGTSRQEERMGEKRGVHLVAWQLVTCPWCVSPWIAAVCVVGLTYFASWFNYVALVFALSAVAGILSERV